jgi:Ca2+-binding EF-hand superfamily protein
LFLYSKEKLNKKQLDYYNEIFNVLDTNKDGLITSYDFFNLFKTFKPNNCAQNSSIDFNQFIKIMTSNENNFEDLEEAFKLFDSDKDGLISLNELQNGLKSIGEHVNINELKSIVKPFVTNNDQKLNYDGKIKSLYSFSNNIIII